MNIWIWYWENGGYNWCKADTKQEALKKAKEMAGRTILVVKESSLHMGTIQEVERLDRQYASMFN